MGKRNNIPEKVSREIWIRAAGRCELCNRDLTTAYLNGSRYGNYGQQAHIRAYSRNGPRADENSLEDNSYDNLMLVCPECHKVIDEDPEYFTEKYLMKAKQEHCEKVKRALDSISRDRYTLIKYSSTVSGNNERISSHEIDSALTEADLFCKDKIVLLEDRNDESGKVIDMLVDNFNKRIRPAWDDGESPNYCIFAFGPMYALIKLGSFFSNYKNEVKVAIRTRQKWILTKETGSVDYLIEEPEVKRQSNDVVLELNVSAGSNRAQITECLPEMDIWSVNASNPGIDIVRDLSDVNKFGTVVVRALDRISQCYPDGTTIHVIPRICNALAVKFGMSVMPKIHTSLKIYDVKNEGVEYICDL